MGALETIESHGCFGGRQDVYAHDSEVLGCRMRFGVFLPEAALAGEDRPVLYFLSGLTCTEQNVITKAGVQAHCAKHGLILVAPDTSPRGPDVADDAAWDLGQGAGFYLTATQAPWSEHYRMDQYVIHELPALIQQFTSSARRGVMGHSMGGHGAVVLALRHPSMYQHVSALSPILQPCDVPWGQKAFTAYLGEDEAAWEAWDASRLLEKAASPLTLRIDQGEADPFLATQLRSERFLAAAEAGGHAVEYHLHPGYDHGYYFVSTVIGAHVEAAARALA